MGENKKEVKARKKAFRKANTERSVHGKDYRSYVRFWQ